MPIMTPLNRLSYGLYIVHVLVLQGANKAIVIQSPPVIHAFVLVSITDLYNVHTWQSDLKLNALYHSNLSAYTYLNISKQAYR